MSKYEDLCGEWHEYILSLDLEQRKITFCKYLEDSGIFELTAETEFYKSDLNQMLVEGVTSLLHQKAQRAKSGTGKGIAHHRALSLAMSNKPDATNVVHDYFWTKMSKHPKMKDRDDIPETFRWRFLFSVPELVAGTTLISDDRIPALPPAPQSTNAKALKYSPDHHHAEPLRDPSPDIFAVDHHADRPESLQIPESKATHQSYQSQLDELLDPEPTAPSLGAPGTADPKDGVEPSPDSKEASFTPYDAAISQSPDDAPSGHQNTETAIISPTALGQYRNSQYLDNWATTETTHSTASKMVAPDTVSPLVNPSPLFADSSVLLHDVTTTHSAEAAATRNVLEAEPLSMSVAASSSNHNKTGSTIKGGWWRDQEQIGSISASLAAAKEERAAIFELLEALQSAHSKRDQKRQSESEEMSLDDAVRAMESKMRTFHSKTIQEMGRMDRAWSERVSQITNDQEAKQRRKSLIWNDDDGNDRKSKARKEETVHFEAKLNAMRSQIESLRNELKSKDAVIGSQAMIIEELRAKQSSNHSVEMLKSQILQQIEAEFDAMRSFEKGRGSTLRDKSVPELVEKQEAMTRTLESVHRTQREIKEQNIAIHQGIDGLHLNADQYQKGMTRKMEEFQSEIGQKVASSSRRGVDHSERSEMNKLSNLTTQLTENMNTAAMLSVLRNEYDNVRKEKEAMRMEVERVRRENDELSLRKKLLEEEAVTNRENKRRTIKNLVDELNDMREQIGRLAHRKGIAQGAK